MSNSILFSIVIPTYNRGHLIARTIDSVLNQTYQNFEVIVIDDGSTDDTDELLLSYTDNRIKYFKKKNEERSVARNFGLKKAKGDYVYLLDSDDIIYSNHLKTAFEYICSEINNDVFFIAYENLNPITNEAIRCPEVEVNINESLIDGNLLSCHGVFMSKIIAHKFKFKEDLLRGEDYEFWLQIASEYEIGYVNKITSALVLHNERSVNLTDIVYLIKHKEKFLNYIKNNPSIVKKYGNHFNKIFSHTYSYISLHAMLAKDKNNGFKYYMKSLKSKPLSFFTRRSMAIIKHLVF